MNRSTNIQLQLAAPTPTGVNLVKPVSVYTNTVGGEDPQEAVKRDVPLRVTVDDATNPGACACRNQVHDAICGMVTTMATKRSVGRPSLGERMRVPVRMTPEVYEALRVEAKSRGISMSQYLADLAAIHLGLPEAVLRLDTQEAIPA